MWEIFRVDTQIKVFHSSSSFFLSAIGQTTRRIPHPDQLPILGFVFVDIRFRSLESSKLAFLLQICWNYCLAILQKERVGDTHDNVCRGRYVTAVTPPFAEFHAANLRNYLLILCYQRVLLQVNCRLTRLSIVRTETRISFNTPTVARQLSQSLILFI